jgi:hypothetical protein
MAGLLLYGWAFRRPARREVELFLPKETDRMRW